MCPTDDLGSIEGVFNISGAIDFAAPQAGCLSQLCLLGVG